MTSDDEPNKTRRQLVSGSLTPQFVIAIIFVAGFMSVLYAIFVDDLILTDDKKDIAMYLLGILSAGMVQVMNFFFGSSAGSKAKTAGMIQN